MKMKNNLENLIRLFRDAATAHYDATLRDDFKATHRTAPVLASVEEELFEHANRELIEITKLLDDSDPGVRLAAALGLAELGNRRAMWTLRKMAWFRNDALGAIAGWRLRQIRKGKR